MARDIRERIQERLKDTGKSMRAASLDGGLGADAIRDLMRRPQDSPTMETIAKLADGLQTTPAWLAFEAGPKTLRPGAMAGGLSNANGAFNLVKLDGPVAAGVFLRSPAFDDDLGEVISAPRDPEYPFARQAAYRVEGDSMNEAKPRPIRDGDFIICVAWDDLGIPERDGLLVVVQQTINGGQLRERSVKALRLYSDRREFVPMSSNPSHEPIVIPRDDDPDDGREVRILALVRYVFDNQVIR
jgi:lambda repressor-like predicted transcriptional regulator